jgi:hypothetical protein
MVWLGSVKQTEMPFKHGLSAIILIENNLNF